MKDQGKRYDAGFRREALALIREGLGSLAIAKRLAMPWQTARDWIMLYRSGGEEAFMGTTGRRSYDWRTRVAAARDHVEGGMSLIDVMAKHAIANVSSLNGWCRKYREGGPEALMPKPKGRPRGARSRPKPEPTRERELAERVAYLEAEVAYLEKLRALRASKPRDARKAPSCTGSQGGATGSTTC